MCRAIVTITKRMYSYIKNGRIPMYIVLLQNLFSMFFVCHGYCCWRTCSAENEKIWSKVYILEYI